MTKPAGTQRLRVAFAASLAAFALTAGALPAHAVVPGSNGRIAFATDREGVFQVYLTFPDGTGQVDVSNDPGGARDPAWSPNGSKIAFVSGRDGNPEIYVMDVDGSNQTRLTTDSAPDMQPTWSPDQKKIAYVNFGTNAGINVMNADGTGRKLIAPGNSMEPTWSPDGSRIAYQSMVSGVWQVFVMNADGSGKVNITNDSSNDQYPAWSPDGSRIAYSQDLGQLGVQIAVITPDGSSRTTLTNDPSSNYWPAWSPDGTQIAFTSDRDGNRELYVMNADGSNQTRITTNAFQDVEADWQPWHFPVIDTIVPGSGPVGRPFDIQGVQLRYATGVGLVDPATGGVVPARFRVRSDTDIRAWVPFGAVTGPVVVQTATGESTSAFDFRVKPSVDLFDPPGGSPGTIVVITGSAFTGATKVTFGGVSATFTVDSYTRIRAMVPAGAVTGKIGVVTAGGKARSRTDFVVT